jgi:DNA-binding transcriptional MerR regulator
MITIQEIKKLLEGNNKRRDDNLDSKLSDLRIEVDKSIKKRLGHFTTAPDTKEQLDDFKNNCTKVSGEYGEKIEKLSELMEENQKMTKEMYEVFTNANWSGKFAVKTFATIGIITGSIIGLIELFKRIK